MNFALILVVLSLASGLIYLFDSFVLNKKTKTGKKTPRWIETGKSFFPIFFTVLLVRSFLIEPFRIPSCSLEPTLLIGDFLIVNKFIYGLRLPVLEKKILALQSPKVGEIVVFRWPPNPKLDFIKRVIGVPGDHIAYHHKVLSVNGKPANQTFVRYTIDESSGQPVAEYLENLNGVKHAIYRHSDIPAQDFELTVPAHSYFVMGDNRDDSADSRYWGFVDDSYLRGKAILIWMSWDSKLWLPRFKRIGQFIN